MSANNSISEQQEDLGDLPDLYNRELMRKKNTVNQSQQFYHEDRDVSEVGGGYRDWKAKNVMESSDRMVSSLGRALHNQGIVSQNDSNYASHHQNDPHSNTIPNSDYRRKDHATRHNSSEPYYTPQNYRTQSNANDVNYRQVNQPAMRPEVNGRLDERKYNHPSQENDEYIPEDNYDERFGGQCCPVQNVNSPMISPKNHHNSNNREFVSPRPNSNFNSSHGNYYYHDSEPQPQHRVNQNFKRSPCHSNDSYHSPQYQGYRQCHPPPPPPPHQNHHCCQPTETPRRPDSPRKKSDSHRKTEASIKKLYRILWLQNEQLGLLEKQVSKLIELNFSKEPAEKPNEVTMEKPTPDAPQIIKPETSEIGIMTDLPCHRCAINENQESPSTSDSEDIKKSVVEESLTLNAVDIPVNGAEVASPPVSMHIDLHEYQDTSSSQTEESDTTEDESEPVGWTFYDNVVGQVNNLLKTANKKKKSQKKKKQTFNDDINMAVEQLKRLGMPTSEYDTNNPKRVTFERGLKEQQVNLRAQSEVSMNFNALASKYLSSTGNKVQDISMCNMISSNTNMSMATMRYLERHQIANRDVVDALSKKSRKSRASGNSAVTSKFLDITAIRQQPKLLPKHL